MSQRIQELDSIWANTRRYGTASVEIATMPDLYDGLEKSGYARESFQREDHLHNCTEFLVFDRGQLEGVLETLQKDKRFSFDEKWIYTRVRWKTFRDMGAVRPSNRLTNEDMESNPFLLALLIGELGKSYYFDEHILTDEENGEVALRCYNREGTFPQTKKVDYTPTEATDFAYRIEEEVAKLSLPGTNKLSLSFETPYLGIPERQIYEATQIPYAMIKMRTLEKRLAEVEGKNQRAEQGVRNGIEQHRKAIATEEGAHFPMFRIL